MNTFRDNKIGIYKMRAELNMMMMMMMMITMMMITMIVKPSTPLDAEQGAEAGAPKLQTIPQANAAGPMDAERA